MQVEQNATLAFVGANSQRAIPEEELGAGHSSVVDHSPADVGIHHTALVAAVYQLQRQLKVITYSNLNGREDQIHISLRRVGLLSQTAVLLSFLQNGSLLHAACKKMTKMFLRCPLKCFVIISVNHLQNDQALSLKPEA